MDRRKEIRGKIARSAMSDLAEFANEMKVGENRDDVSVSLLFRDVGPAGNGLFAEYGVYGDYANTVDACYSCAVEGLSFNLYCSQDQVEAIERGAFLLDDCDRSRIWLSSLPILTPDTLSCLLEFHGVWVER